MTKFILLFSTDSDITISRRYNNFTSKAEVAQTLIEHYEEYLRTTKMQFDSPIEYTSDDLFKFIDSSLGELVCLQLENKEEDLWEPMPKDWVLEATYIYLKSLAFGGAQTIANGIEQMVID